MVVLMRLALISLMLLCSTASSPAKAGHYAADFSDVASGFSRTFSDVASGFSRTKADQEAQVIEISAERFSFNPSEIRVKAGTKLEIRLTSEDTMHGFHIAGTDINLELPKRGRGVASATFTPTAGRYEFECSRLCGAGHSFMRGVIIASE
jgi:cytochrome c oxidase subunit 2